MVDFGSLREETSVKVGGDSVPVIFVLVGHSLEGLEEEREGLLEGFPFCGVNFAGLESVGSSTLQKCTAR